MATFAKITDVTAGLWEKDPITRNNVIRFLFDHFTPCEVLDSLFQYSVASGKRVPGVTFKRYVSLLKDREDLQQKKCILNTLLGDIHEFVKFSMPRSVGVNENLLLFLALAFSFLVASASTFVSVKVMAVFQCVELR